MQTVSTNTLLSAALDYLSKGIQPVALYKTRDGRIVPEKWSGLTGRLRSMEDCIRAFSGQDLYGLALLCGSVSGIVEIDIDNKNGKNGSETWKRHVSGKAVPLTYTEGTKSGGFHYRFRISGSVRTRIGYLEGVDIKGESGLAYVYPTPGYRPLVTVEPVSLPGWLAIDINRRPAPISTPKPVKAMKAQVAPTCQKGQEAAQQARQRVFRPVVLPPPQTDIQSRNIDVFDHLRHIAYEFVKKHAYITKQDIYNRLYSYKNTVKVMYVDTVSKDHEYTDKEFKDTVTSITEYSWNHPKALRRTRSSRFSNSRIRVLGIIKEYIYRRGVGCYKLLASAGLTRDEQDPFTLYINKTDKYKIIDSVGYNSPGPKEREEKSQDQEAVEEYTDSHDHFLHLGPTHYRLSIINNILILSVYANDKLLIIYRLDDSPENKHNANPSPLQLNNQNHDAEAVDDRDRAIITKITDKLMEMGLGAISTPKGPSTPTQSPKTRSTGLPGPLNEPKKENTDLDLLLDQPLSTKPLQVSEILEQLKLKDDEHLPPPADTEDLDLDLGPD